MVNLSGRTQIAMFALAIVATSRSGLAAEREAAVPMAPVARRVVISLPDRQLAVIENDRVVRLYPVAVGAVKSPTPRGTFTIVNRISNPTYYRRGNVIGPGVSNPLGTRWLGLSVKGYGIHGTDEPRSIGHARSHGCVRMHNRDVEELFALVRTGDIVELHDEPMVEVVDVTVKF